MISYFLSFAIVLLSCLFHDAVALVSTTTFAWPKCYLSVVRKRDHVSTSDCSSSTLKTSNSVIAVAKSQNQQQPCLRSVSYRKDALLYLSSPFVEPEGQNENDESSQVLPKEGFVNPFERKVTSTTRRVPHLVSNNISLRQMRMKELMSKLLLANAPGDRSKILLENEDFLLEPLVQEEAVLEKDSIYEVGMTVRERFERYNSVMIQREQQAVNDQVKGILVSMREFVMSRSDAFSNSTDPDSVQH
jgi:hypothetical protein